MLVHDYIHPTPHGGHCRVRIYDATTVVPVIVCTELTDNPGQSITKAAKQIAAEVLENHPHLFDPFALVSIAGLSYDKPFLWVELDELRRIPKRRSWSVHPSTDQGLHAGAIQRRPARPTDLFSPLARPQLATHLIVGELYEVECGRI